MREKCVMEEINEKFHKVVMCNRKTCEIFGVKDVLSFDIHQVVLETKQGRLIIKGDSLHVSRLSLEVGEVDLDGQIDSFSYDGGKALKETKNESFIAKLFR